MQAHTFPVIGNRADGAIYSLVARISFSLPITGITGDFNEMTHNVYEELLEEDAMRLAVQHINRGQKIPNDLMTVLEGYNVADYFKEEASSDTD